MGQSFYINLENSTLQELSVSKRCAPTRQGFVRFQAMEELFRGRSPEEVAQLSDRSVSTIYRWVRAFNENNLLWFGDEVGFEGDPRPRRVWVSLVVPHSDKDVFQIFLDEFAKHTSKTKKNVILVLFSREPLFVFPSGTLPPAGLEPSSKRTPLSWHSFRESL